MTRQARRQVQQIEFRPGEGADVIDAMDTITDAGDGWINLLPGVDPDDAPPPPTGLMAILSPRFAGVTMGTWAPKSQSRSGIEGAKIGLLHTAGRFAARQLASFGIPVPEGWLIRQDNPRRGLILVASLDASNRDVLDWIVAAGTALCSLDTSGMWRADVYLPRPGET
ncbi:MAG: hypothetical protein WAM97_02065 [Acidimicrobiales bacterium]